MLKLTGPLVLLLCLIYLVSSPHYQYLTVMKRRSGEAISRFILNSILFSEKSVQGFMVMASSSEQTECSSLMHAKRRTDIILISTSGCNFQTKLTYASQAGYSVVIFYDNDESYSQIDISTLPRIEMEKLRNDFKYIGKISLEDAFRIKNAYSFPEKVRFHGLITRYDMLADVSLKFFHLYHSSFHMLLILFLSSILVLSTVVHLWKRKTCQSEAREIPKRQYNRVFEELNQMNDQIDDVDYSNDFCLICREIIEDQNDPITILPCQHYYHSLCIDDWFQQNNQHRCPSCRYRVTSADENFEDLSDYELDETEDLESIFPDHVVDALRLLRRRQNFENNIYGIDDPPGN